MSVPSQRHISDSKQTVPYQSDYERLKYCMSPPASSYHAWNRGTCDPNQPETTVHTHEHTKWAAAGPGRNGCFFFFRSLHTHCLDRAPHEANGQSQTSTAPSVHACEHTSQTDACTHACRRRHGLPRPRCKVQPARRDGAAGARSRFLSRRKLGAK